MVPELPEIPAWPVLHWTYNDGFYCLSEADADKLLDYMENRMPLYIFEISRYEEELGAVIDALKNNSD